MKQIDNCKDCYFYSDGVCHNGLSDNYGQEPTGECYLWEPDICCNTEDSL